MNGPKEPESEESGASVEQMTPEDVCEKYDGLVRGVAAAVIRRLKLKIDFEDVLQCGFEGLLDAHQRFDGRRDVSFSSYAYYRVRGAILDGCRREGWWTRERRSRQQRGPDLTDMIVLNRYLEDLHEAQALAPPARTYRDTVQRVVDMVEGVACIVLLQHGELQELEISSQEPSPHEVTSKRERVQQMGDTIRSEVLTDIEQDVIESYHFGEQSMSEIGARLGYSKSWVSRIHARAIDKLRAAMVEGASGKPPYKR